MNETDGIERSRIREETDLGKTESSISTKQLTVGYDRIPLICGVDLSVQPGEILTLIGPNGSGKSTILKTITRQLKKLGGEVYIGGRAGQGIKDSEMARELSMVMTERIRTELMTGRDVVASGRYPYTGKLGILSAEDWKKVDEAIALVHAKDAAEQDFSKISDGQRQRLMLARAICQDTKILILDEPTSYLDMGFKLDILSNIRMLAREKQIAVIMSLHELDLAEKISDQIVCVKGDRIDKTGKPEEIFTGNYIQKLYGVKDENFDPLTGQMFLPVQKDAPKVFVIGGGGSGIHVYNRLSRENIPFAAGILEENDMEFQTACALATEVVWEKAFYPIGEDKTGHARKLIDQCESCICAVTAFGPNNDACRILREYAAQTGKLKEEWAE